MDRSTIVEYLTEERDRLQRAIDALTEDDVTADPPKVPRIVKPPKKAAKPCKHACGKEFTSPLWLDRHEKDCALVVRGNGSADVGRRIG